MSQIVVTPEPPYYAVIAPAVLADEVGGYPQLAQQLLEAAAQIDGFLGIETCYRGNFVMAVSYWRSLQAIDRWRRHPAHAAAKDKGRNEWFREYVTRIARVERVY